jgi:hypothetical protein
MVTESFEERKLRRSRSEIYEKDMKGEYKVKGVIMGVK